mgnify:FL=1
MPKILKAQIRSFLHDYRKEVFELEHAEDKLEKRRQAAGDFAQDVLDQKFHYHLHKKVDPDRVEVIQLIHNYCTEALLPPILLRLAEEILLGQERHVVALDMVRQVLDTLAEEDEA